MNSLERQYLLAVIGHALDADPANVEWFQAVTPAEVDVLNFVNYDAGVQTGLLIEARAQEQAKTFEKQARRRRAKHRKAKARP